MGREREGRKRGGRGREYDGEGERVAVSLMTPSCMTDLRPHETASLAVSDLCMSLVHVMGA